MRLKQGCRLFWVALVAFVLDRATKVWSLTLEGGAEALPGLLNFQPVRNYGAAFGVFAGRQALLSALVLLLCAAVLFLLLRFARMPVSARVGLWLIFAGGLSNLYDRLRYGYVIDFLELGFIRFPVFNVADIGVTCGFVLALVGAYRYLEWRDGELEHAAQEAAEAEEAAAERRRENRLKRQKSGKGGGRA